MLLLDRRLRDRRLLDRRLLDRRLGNRIFACCGLLGGLPGLLLGLLRYLMRLQLRLAVLLNRQRCFSGWRGFGGLGLGGFGLKLLLAALFFDGLLSAEPSPLAGLSARSGKITVLGTVQIGPRV